MKRAGALSALIVEQASSLFPINQSQARYLTYIHSKRKIAGGFWQSRFRFNDFFGEAVFA
jgi:hypothetical protein